MSTRHVAIFFAAALSCILLLLLYSPLRTPVLSCSFVLVIDCGSSGTRLYAYTWRPGLSQHDLPEVEAIKPSAAEAFIPKKTGKGLYDRVETQPGMDAFESDPAGLSTRSLGPLLAWARAVVPPGLRSSTPLFLLATAGIRKLPEPGRTKLLQAARAELLLSGFRFESEWARIITGSEEGLYGWVSLNYAMGALGTSGGQTQDGGRANATGGRKWAMGAPGAASFSSSAEGVRNGGSVATIGALDLGGSSLEVTMEVHETMQQANPPQPPGSTSGPGSTGGSFSSLQGGLGDASDVVLPGLRYRLQTYTLRRYGLNDAFDRSVTLLLQRVEAKRPHVAKAIQAAAGGSPPGSSPISQSWSGSGSQPSRGDSPNLLLSGSATARGIAENGSSLLRDTAAKVPITLGTDSSGRVEEEEGARRERADALVLGGEQLGGGGGGRVGGASADGGAGDSGTGVTEAGSAAAAAHIRSNLRLPELTSLPARLGSAALRGGRPATADAGSHSAAAAVAAEEAAAGMGSGVHQSLSGQTAAEGARVRVFAIGSITRSAGSEWLKLPPGLAVSASSGEPAMPEAADLGSGSDPSGSRPPAMPEAAGAEEQSRRRGVLSEGSSMGKTRPTQLAHPTPGTGKRGHVVGTRTGRLKALMPADAVKSSPSATEASSVVKASKLGSSSSDNSVDAGSGGSGGGATAARSQDLSRPPGPSLRQTVSPTGFPMPSSSIPSDAAARSSAAASAAATAAAVVAPSSADVLVLHHPCLHDGYSAPYLRLQDSGVAPQTGSVLLKGAPDWQACSQLAHELVQSVLPCVQQPCPAQLQPLLPKGPTDSGETGRCMGLAGFYVVWKFFGLPPNATMQQVLEKSRGFCSRGWPHVLRDLGGSVNLERYCLWGPYVIQLLREGLKVEQQHLGIGGGEVSWALGAALVEASRIPDLMTGGQTRWRRRKRRWWPSSSSDTSSSLTAGMPGQGRSLPSRLKALSSAGGADAGGSVPGGRQHLPGAHVSTGYSWGGAAGVPDVASLWPRERRLLAVAEWLLLIVAATVCGGLLLVFARGGARGRASIGGAGGASESGVSVAALKAGSGAAAAGSLVMSFVERWLNGTLPPLLPLVKARGPRGNQLGLR